MELRYKREASVGLLIIVGVLAFVFLMMWLRGKSLSHGEIVRVSFNDVGGLKEGDPVRTSGVTVGHVTTIRLVGPGNVEVDFDIKEGPSPHADASARILSQDFFGAKFVDYLPGTARERLAADKVLQGQRVEDISELATSLGGRTRTMLDTLAVTTIVVARELRNTMASMQRLLATLNSGASTSSQELAGTLQDLRRSMQRVDQLLVTNGPTVTEAVRGMRGAAQQADSLTRVLSHASAQFDSILTKVNSGAGPAAAMLNDSTVIRDLMQTNAALRELLIDFKANPGRYIRLRL